MSERIHEMRVSKKQKAADIMKILAEYIILIHVPYFLKSPLATAVPRQDRDLCFDLGEYKKCFDDSSVQNAMINAAQESLKNHMWYLSTEIVVRFILL